MLQIELRANGCLVDFVTIVRTGVAHEMPGCFIYTVTGTDGRKEFVTHEYKDGAMKLAALALAALTTKPRIGKKRKESRQK